MALPNLDGEYENQLNVARKLIMKIKDKTADFIFDILWAKYTQHTNKIMFPHNFGETIALKLLIKQDRGVALKYVNLLTSLKSNDPLVKRNRNAFFKHFLQVLENQLNIEARQKILCTCPIQHEEALSDPLKYLQKEGMATGEKVTTHWSKDKRSYVSAKIIPGKGALLYMACNNDPECDWDTRETPKKT